jgi:Na+-driven multidrug efflux pump
MVTGAGLFLILGIFGHKISIFFNNDPGVASVSGLYLSLVSISYGAIGVSMTASSCFSALHKPYSAIFVNVIRMFVIFIPAALVGSYFGGLFGLFIGITVSILTGSVFADLWLKRTVRILSAKQIVT